MIKSIYNRNVNPYFQGGIVIASNLIICCLVKFVDITGISEVDPMNYWIIGAAFLLFYALFNSMFSLSSKDQNAYWGQSILAYMAVALVSVFLGRIFSKLGLEEAASMKWIYLVLTLVYIIFLTIVRLMRKIVNIAIKQDKRLRGED